MFRVTPDNVEQKRTIRPLYAMTQATPYSCYLDPKWDRSIDILPGMVMSRTEGDNVVPFGSGTNATKHSPLGLSALFVAPKLGIDEVRPTGTNLFAVWVGDNQSTFEVLAPAFATTGVTWTTPTEANGPVPLRVTLAGHADGPGKLTNEASGSNVSTAVVARLVEVVGTTKIIISLDTAEA